MGNHQAKRRRSEDSRSGRRRRHRTAMGMSNDDLFVRCAKCGAQTIESFGKKQPDGTVICRFCMIETGQDKPKPKPKEKSEE